MPDLLDTIADLRKFIGTAQLDTMLTLMHGEEGEWFRAKLIEMHQRVSTMPTIYAQDGLGMQSVAHLHYFTSGADWWITERDSEPVQRQAYGWADLGFGPGCPELGYISILELIRNRAELDLHFEPTKLCDIPKIKEEACG